MNQTLGKRMLVGLFLIGMLAGCAPQQAHPPGNAQTNPQYIKEIKVTFTANFALTSDGTVLAWGINEYGVLGLGEVDRADTPQVVEIGEPIKELVTSPVTYTVFAIAESGNVYGWGSNLYKITSSEDIEEYPTPILMDLPVPYSEIALSHHLVTILDPDGNVYGYGWNQQGGMTHTEEGESFLYAAHEPEEIVIGNTEPVIQFENRAGYRAFLDKAGNVYLHGLFIEGKTNFEKAARIPFPEPIIQIGPLYQGLVGLSGTGKLYFIGEDRFGIGGDYQSEYFEVFEEPMRIDKIQEEIARISTSANSILVETRKGDIYTWGYNMGKKISDTDQQVIVTPSKLDFKGKVRDYYCGELSTVCITENDEVYGWGTSYYGLYMGQRETSSAAPVKLDFSSYL